MRKEKEIDYKKIATEILGSSDTEEKVIEKYKLPIDADELHQSLI